MTLPGPTRYLGKAGRGQLDLLGAPEPLFLVAVYQRRSIVTELWCELVGVDQLLRRAV